MIRNWLIDGRRMVLMKTLTTLAIIIIVAGARTTGALQQTSTDSASGQLNGGKGGIQVRGADDGSSFTTGSEAGRDSTDATTSSSGNGVVSEPSSISNEQLGRASDSSTSSPATTGGSTPSSGTVTTPSPQPVAARFRDGTYSAVGTYTIPTGRTESIGVTLVLSSDVIVDSSIEPMADDPRSQNFEADFIANYKSYVTGKKVDEVNLTKVSGSSLTNIGFNNATDKIEGNAKN